MSTTNLSADSFERTTNEIVVVDPSTSCPRSGGLPAAAPHEVVAAVRCRDVATALTGQRRSA